MFHPPCILENWHVFLFLPKEDDCYSILFYFFVPQQLKLTLSKDTASSGCPTWNGKGEGSEPKHPKKCSGQKHWGGLPGLSLGGGGDSCACVRVLEWWPSIWGHVGFCVPPGTALSEGRDTAPWSFVVTAFTRWHSTAIYCVSWTDNQKQTMQSNTGSDRILN